LSPDDENNLTPYYTLSDDVLQFHQSINTQKGASAMQINLTNTDILALIRLASQYLVEAQTLIELEPNNAATSLRLANDMTEQAAVLLTVANQE
jgi:heat shock protein HslJ